MTELEAYEHYQNSKDEVRDGLAKMNEVAEEAGLDSKNVKDDIKEIAEDVLGSDWLD